MTIGARVRQAREAKGESLEQAARGMLAAVHVLRDVEANKQVPSDRFLELIARYYGTHPATLRTGEEREPLRTKVFQFPSR